LKSEEEQLAKELTNAKRVRKPLKMKEMNLMTLKKLSEKLSILLKGTSLILTFQFQDNKVSLLNSDLKKVLCYLEGKEKLSKLKSQRLMEKLKNSMLKLDLHNLKSKLQEPKKLVLLPLKLLPKIEFKLKKGKLELQLLKAKLPVRLLLVRSKR
jgi:hypothetical protein